MAKVTNPLMSLSAKGSIGKGALNFQTNGQSTHVRHMRTSVKKEPSQKQKKTRDCMGLCVKVWANLHFLDKEHWGKILGDPRGYRLMLPNYAPRTGYHLFMRRNFYYLERDGFAIFSPFSDVNYIEPGTVYITEDIKGF